MGVADKPRVLDGGEERNGTRGLPVVGWAQDNIEMVALQKSGRGENRKQTEEIQAKLPVRETLNRTLGFGVHRFIV